MGGSHRNTVVSEDAVFVDLEKDNLLQYPDLIECKPKAGDLIVWHARSIHKIDGPKSEDWGTTKRRVFGWHRCAQRGHLREQGACPFLRHGLAWPCRWRPPRASALPAHLPEAGSGRGCGAQCGPLHAH